MPGKNDWNTGDTGTRTNMNRPFWLSSGTVAAGNVAVQISPGRIRYPYNTAVLYSGQSQPFTMNGAAVNTYYTVFQRSDGTFMASGTTALATPGRPRWDAEYLGTIFTGASVSTANLKGPWNAAAFEQWEQRGEYTAPFRPRAVYDKETGTGSLLSTSFTSLVTASGISYLTFPEPGGDNLLRSTIYAEIRWIPSGSIGVSPADLYMTPVFTIVDSIQPTAALSSNRRTYRYTVAQTPDAPVPARGSQEAATTTMVAINSNNAGAAGYTLKVHFDMNSQSTDNSNPPGPPGIRIQEIIFFALPGWYSVSLNEPS